MTVANLSWGRLSCGDLVIHYGPGKCKPWVEWERNTQQGISADEEPTFVSNVDMKDKLLSEESPEEVEKLA